MALTWNDLLAAATHAVGGDVSDGGNSAPQIVNRALDFLTDAHPWSWRRVIASLDMAMGQSYVSLPGDFGTLEQVSNNAADFVEIKGASPYDLLEARKRDTWSTTGRLLFLMGGRSPDAGTDDLDRVVEIAPTPQTDLDDAIYISYLRRVAYYVEGTTAATDTPELPPGMHAILLQLVRAFAVSDEEQQAGSDWEMAKMLLDTAKAADSNESPQAGVRYTPVPGQLTFGDLKAEAEQVAGLDPQGRLNAARFVNRAIERFITGHDWTFRRASVKLSVVADQSYVALPDDFGELVLVRGTGDYSRYTTFKQVQEEELHGFREHGVTDGLFLAYRLGVSTADGTSVPRYQLELGPVPHTDRDDSIEVVYRPLIPQYAQRGSEDDAKVVPIPTGFHDALASMVRLTAARAASTNPQSIQFAESDYAQAMQGAIDYDARQESILMGPMRGTYVPDYDDAGPILRPHREIVL